MERYSLMRRIAVAGLLFAGSLTISACSSEGSGQTPSPSPNTDADAEPHIEAEYFKNGGRILRYLDDDGQYSDILQFCDGADLLEQTEFLKYGYGAGGANVERTSNHPACADGVLTPEEF